MAMTVQEKKKFVDKLNKKIDELMEHELRSVVSKETIMEMTPENLEHTKFLIELFSLLNDFVKGAGYELIELREIAERNNKLLEKMQQNKK